MQYGRKVIFLAIRPLNNLSISLSLIFRVVSVRTGVQPDFFQERKDFVELGHFDKYFVNNAGKEAPSGKILEFFLLDTLKTTFWMENLTQRWIQSGPFYSKSGYFCRFWKKGKGGLPLFPLSCAPAWIPLCFVFWKVGFLELANLRINGLISSKH